MSGLDTPLTPLRFLGRAAEVHPEKIAIIDGQRTFTYAEFAATVTRLARGLRASGVKAGERVAYLTSNSAELLVAHYAIPLARAVLVAINTRLAAREVQHICDHAGAVVLVGDAALLCALGENPTFETVREIVETPSIEGNYDDLPGTVRYEELLSRGSDEPLAWEVDDESRTITINYTSGTTDLPKGVMYTHRGAYLGSLGAIYHQGFDFDTRYLWTLPMFHCNGWCATWAVTAVTGTHVCLRTVRGDVMWRLIDTERVDHLCGAPTVLSTVAFAPEAHALDRPLTVVTAAAPPSPAIISTIRRIGATLVHVYGLTETYGPYSICETKPDWQGLSDDEQSRLLTRQGVGMLTADQLRVVRAEPDASGRLVDVAADGSEMGEIVMRGNIVMKGYFRDEAGTAAAFAGGWFHSGDLGVMHPDGYMELLDRAKDVIISGGENISTIEVQNALLSHRSVAEAAVIGVSDEKWGERPKAFVVLAPQADVGEEELTAHVKARIASYKAPRSIEFLAELPKTSTGKVRKSELRESDWSGVAPRVRG